MKFPSTKSLLNSLQKRLDHDLPNNVVIEQAFHNYIHNIDMTIRFMYEHDYSKQEIKDLEHLRRYLNICLDKEDSLLMVKLAEHVKIKRMQEIL